jgi:hypothetical protein
MPTEQHAGARDLQLQQAQDAQIDRQNQEQTIETHGVCGMHETGYTQPGSRRTRLPVLVKVEQQRVAEHEGPEAVPRRHLVPGSLVGAEAVPQEAQAPLPRLGGHGNQDHLRSAIAQAAGRHLATPRRPSGVAAASVSLRPMQASVLLVATVVCGGEGGGQRSGGFAGKTLYSVTCGAFSTYCQSVCR